LVQAHQTPSGYAVPESEVTQVTEDLHLKVEIKPLICNTIPGQVVVSLGVAAVVWARLERRVIYAPSQPVVIHVFSE
jgi:hypothetical protein